MKDILYYYYNIYFDDITEYHNCYFLNYRGKKYIFKSVEIDLDSLNNVIYYLEMYGVKYHNIILNSNKEIFSSFNGKKYILIIVNYYYRYWFEFEKLIVDKVIVNNGQIWEKKIEYYVERMNKSETSNLLFIALFNYYIGLGELAISIANRLMNNEVILTRSVAHRRISCTFDCISYFDPTDMVIDSRIRDYSEYLKSCIISGKTPNTNLVLRFIKGRQYSIDEISLLFARLLYPSYYFDELDMFFNGDKSDNDFNLFFSILKRYEQFMYDFSRNLVNLYGLFNINWIKK